MNLLYKEDWEATQQRFRAWWAHEYFGRAAIAVRAPRKNPPPGEEPERPSTPEERWTDLDYISALSDYHAARTFFGGESFPDWGYGYPGNKRLGAFLGCRVTLDFRTGWLDPVLTGDEIDWRSLVLDEDEPHFQFTLRWLDRCARDAGGKAVPGVGAFGGCGDTLAAVRGTDRLLYDVIDRPDQVREADQHLMDLWIRVYDRFYGIIRDAAGGSTCWFPLWSPGKFYVAQNDFSYSIGPKMFRDLFLPTIEKQTNFLDHTMYHVDGVGSFAHVDALCELPRLQAIQILPGAGKPSPLH
ncbi:MAG TPA: hypothetical protein VMX57_08290, partial [Planctomycetota bacterium]|nr:hypothetical protein [Planctomycetota bacterium]